MTRHRVCNVSLLKQDLAETDAQLNGKRIYVFRCNENGLYAFTTDREGHRLPLQMYPQITWRFEQALTLRLDENSWDYKIVRAILNGVAECGFHLVHSAVYGELLDLITPDWTRDSSSTCN